MQGLPPIRYIRKTTLFFLVVFLCFIAHRILVSVTDLEPHQAHHTAKESKALYSVL